MIVLYIRNQMTQTCGHLMVSLFTLKDPIRELLRGGAVIHVGETKHMLNRFTFEWAVANTYISDE